MSMKNEENTSKINKRHTYIVVTTPNHYIASEAKSDFFLFLGKKATMTTIEPHNHMMNICTPSRKQTTTTQHTCTMGNRAKHA